MHGTLGIPIGPKLVRRVRNCHGQRLICIPAPLADALLITAGDYVALEQLTGGAVLLYRWTQPPPVIDVQRPTP